MRSAGAYDHSLLLETLSGFAATLIATDDVDTILGELTEHVTAVLDLIRSGATLMRRGA